MMILVANLAHTMWNWLLAITTTLRTVTTFIGAIVAAQRLLRYRRGATHR